MNSFLAKYALICRYSKSVMLVCLALLSACTSGPDYQRPPLDIPTAYREGDNGVWRESKPQDELDRGAWWSIYDDPVLDDLEKQVLVSNQSLKAAEAAFQQARAVTEETRTSLFPSISLNASSGRQNGSMPTPTASNSVYGSASWTLDVWGRIRREIERDEAKAQASEADLAAAKLSIQTVLATNYFDLRLQDELMRLYGAKVRIKKMAAQVAQREYRIGIGSAEDIHLAQIELENIESQAANIGINRAKLEHAIAVLIGKTPSSFSLLPQAYVDLNKDVPVVLPSALLERRPDIASAERAVIAVNAQIGVTQAAWFPDLTLSASSGYADMTFSKLLQASNSFWAFGYSGAQTIFDAGARAAREDQAIATYDQSVADYKQTVLSAFQQVEDGLATLRILDVQSEKQKAALIHARETEKLAKAQYVQGVGSYIGTLMAESNRLNSEEAWTLVRASRLDSTAVLIQAIGGGWKISQMDNKK